MIFTEDDIPSGYSSEPDEYASEHVQDALLEAKPFEVYIGNTGKVCFEEFYTLFRTLAFVEDITFWRTHNHLYHARIVFRSSGEPGKVIKLTNGQMVFNKRIRVTYAKDRVDLNFPAAVRIDDISADVTEEDIYDHFRSCGDIRFVIKTGYAAYIQFGSSESVKKALKLEMILNGDPCTLNRISTNDMIDHIQVIENMKDIKYRKPFVIVENYPELPKGTPLRRYKSMFESVATVRHFKIAPMAGGTVSLALCIDKADDRNSVIDRFNGAIIGDKRLKLYMAPGKARMTAAHVAQYAICKNSITVECVRPYFKEYAVCMLFSKCGSISFLEKPTTRWIICFDDPSAASRALNFHVFLLYKKELKIRELNQQTFQGGKGVKLQDPDAHSIPPLNDQEQPNEAKPSDQNLLQTKANQTQKIDALCKILETPKSVKVTPEVQPKPSTSQSNKRPANVKESSTDRNPLMEDSSADGHKFRVTVNNLPKGIDENDVRELLRGYEMKRVSLFCNKDLYYPTSVAFIWLTSKPDVKKVTTRHQDRVCRRKRIIIYRDSSVFLPERSIMLKDLTKNFTEEYISERLKILSGLKVVDVMKPAHHYAYVDFTGDVQLDEKLLNSLRNALKLKVDVLPLYAKLPKICLGIPSLEITLDDRTRESCQAVPEKEANDLEKELGVHNAHKLFVGNIPRDTEPIDVIDYFNNFGSVIGYTPIEKKSCHLRQSAILSFVNSKHAQNANCQQPHFLEGSLLDVYLIDSPPTQTKQKEKHIRFITVKFHSPFLTNDEILYTLQQKLPILDYHIRFDAFDDRANYVANYKVTNSAKSVVGSLFEIQYINDEAVKIVEGYDLTPPTEDEAREKEDISNSPYRQQKENYLSFAINKEKLRDEMKVRTMPNKQADIPFKSFYNSNSVQINNVSIDTSLENIRDLLVKCGDIIDYQVLILEEDATKICFVKFKIELAAELACTYSHRMVNGKRILVHLATETLRGECDRSVLVERLSPSTTTEQLHDAFTKIGVVKYVQKQSPSSAIVCFKDKDSIREAVNVTTIPKSGSFIVNPCSEEYDLRLFKNFSYKELSVPIERMQAALTPRILPEFHQLELERQMLETLPDNIKTQLIKEVLIAREQLPNFNILSKHQQIEALKTKYPCFTQKEHFLRLIAREQEKLLTVTSDLQQDDSSEEEEEEEDLEMLPPALVTSDLQQDYSSEEEEDLVVLPPAPKLSRKEEPVNKKPDKPFPANWASSPSEEAEPTLDSYPSYLGPQRSIEPLVTGINASYGARPASDMLRFPGNNQPMRPWFPNTYSQQYRPQFSGGMPPFGGHNRHPTRGPRPGPMEMRPAGGGQADRRWMQQRMAAIAAYNGGPDPRGATDFSGFDESPYSNWG